MIITKCPLRISLVGGSTDLESFINKVGYGSVISFPCNKYVYITLHDNNRGKFFINYSKKEAVDSIEEIQNDVAREVLLHFSKYHNQHKSPFKGLSISFNSDVYSEGGGLAASSAYMIALIKAMVMYTGSTMSNIEICQLALEIERKFNPLTGRQDTYGCGMANFKKSFFRKGVDYPDFIYFKTNMLANFNMFLVHTGINRSSTTLLQNINTDKCLPLLDDVTDMELALQTNDETKFIEVMNRGWENKKTTNKDIMHNNRLLKLETAIKYLADDNGNTYKRGGLRLCGAGGGGYFLVFTRNAYFHHKLIEQYGIESIKINIDEDGVRGMKI